MASQDNSPQTLQFVGSLLSDETDQPLARLMPRRDPLQKLTSLWSGIDDGVHDISLNLPSPIANDDGNAHFYSRISGGVHTRGPERASYVLGRRRFATMADESDDYFPELPRDAGSVRLRQEHFNQRGANRSLFPPRLMISVSSTRAIIPTVRNAVVRELRDLERIIQSLEARKYDLCPSDIHALFAWFKPIENLIRHYLTVAERVIYKRAHAEQWGSGRGLWCEEERRAAKVAIVILAERMESLRRPMIAKRGGAYEMLPDLRERVAAFAKKVVNFLDEEVEQVGRMMEDRLSLEAQEEVMFTVMRGMRKGELGKAVVILVSQGLGASRSEREGWIRDVCKKFSKLVVHMWIKWFDDRHVDFLRMFEAAEEEYRRLYVGLARELDSRIVSAVSIHAQSTQVSSVRSM